MAAYSTIPAELLLSRRVQEMVLNREEPQPQHLSRDDGNCKEDDHNVPSPIPVINLSNASAQELRKIQSALTSWGCFQVIGHGIPTSLLENIRQVAREFFEQPMEERSKYAKEVNEFEGYGADPVPAEGQTLDWSDRLFLDVYPVDRRKPKFWPENPTSFREVLENYTANIKMLAEQVSKAMAKSLNLKESSFLDQFGERAALQARFNYYSPCQRPDLVLGLKAHADGSGYTIILQDDVAGLQVLKEGQWFTVPTISDALLILMGDQMEIMTNGIFKSPVHRVLTNTEKGRISIAVFYTPEPDKEIGPEGELISQDRPRIYKKIKNYEKVHFDHYQQGKRALHVAHD